VRCGKSEVCRWLEAFPRALTTGASAMGQWRVALQVGSWKLQLPSSVYGVQYAKKAMKPSNF